MKHVHIHIQNAAQRIRVSDGASVITVPFPRRPGAVGRRTADAFSASEYEDLANRMAAALEELMGWKGTQDDWEESKHPRKDNGQFGKGAGGAAPASSPKPTSTKAKTAKAGMHELLSSGHAFSKQELISITGIKSEKLFTDYIAMLKNPKYAGSAGALNIVSKNGQYVVEKTGGASAPAAAAPAPAPAAAPAQPPAQPEPPKPQVSTLAAKAMEKHGFKEAAPVQIGSQTWMLYTKGQNKILLGTGVEKGTWVSESPGHQTKHDDNSGSLEKLLSGGVAGTNMGFNVGLAQAVDKMNASKGIATTPSAAPSSPPKSQLEQLHSDQKSRLASMDSEYQKVAANQTPTTVAEAYALNNYTGAGYKTMNNALRKGRGKTEGLSADSANEVKLITEYLDKASLPETIVTTRGIKGEFAEALASSLDEGSIFIDHGFVSTGLGFAFNGGASMKVTVPKGSKAAAVSHIGGNLSEKEILLQRGSRFHVDKVVGNTFHVTLLPPKEYK